VIGMLPFAFFFSIGCAAIAAQAMLPPAIAIGMAFLNPPRIP